MRKGHSRISCASAMSSGVLANLSHTGFSAATKAFLSISDARMIFAPPLRRCGFLREPQIVFATHNGA